VIWFIRSSVLQLTGNEVYSIVQRPTDNPEAGKVPKKSMVARSPI